MLSSIPPQKTQKRTKKREFQTQGGRRYQKNATQPPSFACVKIYEARKLGFIRVFIKQNDHEQCALASLRREVPRNEAKGECVHKAAISRHITRAFPWPRGLPHPTSSGAPSRRGPTHILPRRIVTSKASINQILNDKLGFVDPSHPSSTGAPPEGEPNDSLPLRGRWHAYA